ncbi:Rod shape-determining protein MreC [Gluconacetobacter diazotrophicus PA1 5]|uniref:Cell shape-determining protein MreC n=2 Tax=Gluconacetobacter diazotrophicus TaxID=33996 RepID=A9HM95_GLUDA|nr:rod shape-determining protein MreC [Gluconacetobacter diazotrophicus]ACI50374.1 Rod shape-determining protein MreC [Gluconacetobacter diazotrophicus PA1 5]MBB2154707.1 rod shape-determining protein MreC [Gluconacetobacter diazotrophicus]TWB08331.1 rod shape-determining protein MreC [Gluconacetobacter diazotrophicus]CAP56279.1 putative rod shape-determining protein mreC [Gluconacetobacter diazotrophicus PA1 5]
MIPLSIPLRQALDRLVLPLLIVAAVGIMLLGQADRGLTERVRMSVADILAPAYGLIVWPQEKFHGLFGRMRDMGRMEAENQRLRLENANLRHWYDVAAALADENAALKANLHWMPDPAPSFVTGRVVRDTSGLYARSVLVAANVDAGIHKDEIVLDASGLVGRVTEVGARSVRVLLVTDASSRIPVTLEVSHGAAIMAGDNSGTPRLIYYPQDTPPIEGERVVTNGEIDSLPPGLPVGRVHYPRAGQPVIVPAASLEHLDIVRVFDYGRSAVVAPDAPGRVPLLRPGSILSVPFQSPLGRG